VTLATAAFAVVHYDIPLSHTLLSFDRARILQGQWWRLLTGSLIHPNPEFLVRDIATFLAFGSCAEYRLGEFYFPVLVVTAVVTSLASLFAPTTNYILGISTLTTAFGFYVFLHECAMNYPSKKILLAINVFAVLALIGKTADEFILGGAFFFSKSGGVPPNPWSHAIGCAAGFSIWLGDILIRGRLKPSTFPRPHRLIAALGVSVWLAIVLARAVANPFSPRQFLLVIPIALWLAVVANSFRPLPKG
jgi:membrane associated rhomboid family serine protease